LGEKEVGEGGEGRGRYKGRNSRGNVAGVRTLSGRDESEGWDSHCDTAGLMRTVWSGRERLRRWGKGVCPECGRE
jgi:hypothetical protein